MRINGETMLSFQLSVMDIILGIALVALALLYFSQKSGQPTNKSEPSAEVQEQTPETDY